MERSFEFVAYDHESTATTHLNLSIGSQNGIYESPYVTYLIITWIDS